MLVFSSLHANPIRDFIAYIRTVLRYWVSPQEPFNKLLVELNGVDYPLLRNMLLEAEKDSGRRIKSIRRDLLDLKQEIWNLR